MPGARRPGDWTVVTPMPLPPPAPPTPLESLAATPEEILKRRRDALLQSRNEDAMRARRDELLKSRSTDKVSEEDRMKAKRDELLKSRAEEKQRALDEYLIQMEPPTPEEAFARRDIWINDKDPKTGKLIRRRPTAAEIPGLMNQ